MENWKKNLRELGDKCFEGEVTVPKTELWLVLTACFLAGILYGLGKAPLTHGVLIGCGNGCGNGNSCHCGMGGGKKAAGRKTEPEEADVPGDRECGQGGKHHGKRKHCGKRRG